MEIKKGMFITTANRVFRVVGEEMRRLWKGAPTETECVITIGIDDGVAREIVFKKEQFFKSRDITNELEAITIAYRALTPDEVDESFNFEIENRKLRVQLKKKEDDVIILEGAVKIAQESLEEKQAIIDEFEGGAADIRMAAHGQSIADIRAAVTKQ